MLFRVTATGNTADSPATSEWYERFRTLLCQAPSGITVDYEENSSITVGPQGEYAGADDFYAFVTEEQRSLTEKARRLSRGLMYWLIEQLWQELDVRCRQWGHSYKNCSCDPAMKFLDPQQIAAEDYWAISWESLAALPVWQAPQSESSPVATLALAFIRYVKVKDITISYHDVQRHFQKRGLRGVVRDTDRTWRILVVLTHGLSAIHAGCQQKYGDCRCPSQIVPGVRRLAYRIAEPGLTRLMADERIAARGLLMEWVIPYWQLTGVTLADIAVGRKSFKYTDEQREKVMDVVRSLVESVSI